MEEEDLKVCDCEPLFLFYDYYLWPFFVCVTWLYTTVSDCPNEYLVQNLGYNITINV